MKNILKIIIILFALAIIIQIIFGSAASFLPGDTLARIAEMIGTLGSGGLIFFIIIIFLLWYFFIKNSKTNKALYKNEKIQENKANIRESDSSNESNKVGNSFKKCPYCAEEILKKAIKCKHCGELID